MIKGKTEIKMKSKESGYDEDINACKEHLTQIRLLQFEANERLGLVTNASISRYKDHGDLMKAIVLKMKLNLVMELINSNLKNLNLLTENIVHNLEEFNNELQNVYEKQEIEREKKLSFSHSLISLLISVTAVSTIVNTIFNLDYIKQMSVSTNTEAVITLAAISLILTVILGIYIKYK